LGIAAQVVTRDENSGSADGGADATDSTDWQAIAQLMSVAPARIGQVADQGQPIEPGSIANLAIWDPSVETTVSGERLASRSGNTPYAGFTLPGAVRHVLFRGRPSVVDGGLA